MNCFRQLDFDMLKFVSTKPPRGRSASGSITPDREVSNHHMFRQDSPSKMHSSPRFARKYNYSQVSTYPSSRAVQSSAKSHFQAPYEPAHSTSGSYTISSPREIRRFGNKEQFQQQYGTIQPLLEVPQLKQQKQSQPQTILYHNGTDGQKYSILSEDNMRKVSPLSTNPGYKDYMPSENQRTVGGTQDSYHLHTYRNYPNELFDHVNQTAAESPGFHISKRDEASRNLPQTKSNIFSREAIDESSVRKPIKITPRYIGKGGFSDVKSVAESPDYDLAKVIPDDPCEVRQSNGPRTTQYITKETLTKKKTSTTYIPPTVESEFKPYAAQEVIKYRGDPSSPGIHRRFDHYHISGTKQPNVYQAEKFSQARAGNQQVMTTCVPQVTSKSSNGLMNKTQVSNKSFGISSQAHSSLSTSTMRDMLNKSQEHSLGEAALTLDVVHITNRIISMTFPSNNHDTTYSFHLKEAVRVLKAKYGDHFLILNLSEKHQNLDKVHPQVKEFGWPDHLAPPLERLCSLCKAIDTWLSTDIRHVVVLHCKGGKSRIASIIAAYIHYNNICASADQAVDSRAMKQYYDEKLGGLPLPSQRRYVSYFSGLLSGAIKINSNPLYLHHILIHGVPNFDTKGGCCPYIKVYQSMQPVFTSGVYNVTDNMQKVCISITPGIPLRGDILIKCYHKKTALSQKEIIWQCQFHTCAIANNNVIFSKQELDDAASDPRFPETGKVEFVFGPSSDVLVSVSGFKSDVTVPVVGNEESLARSDSYEDFNKYSEIAVDGHAGQNLSFNSHYTSSAATSNTLSPPFSSPQVLQTEQTSSTLTRKTGQTFDERMQLDELLSNLLSDQVYVSPNQESSRSIHIPVQTQTQPQISPRGANDSITISPVMNNAKTVTTTTRTFTTYSATDAHRNPDAVLIQRAEVSYKVPTQAEDKDRFPGSTDMIDTSQPHHPKGVPNNAFSYTSGLSSSSQRGGFVEHRGVRIQPEQAPEPVPSPQQTYYPKYESGMDTTPSNYSALDRDSDSWLVQQQQKLKYFRDGRDSSGHTEQEKKLVNELKFAQNKYYTHFTEKEIHDKASVDTYNKQSLHNGPASSGIDTLPYPAQQRSQSSSAVDGQWRDQSVSTAVYSESRAYGDSRSNKPPPSPIMQRSLPPGSGPLPVPVRSSSKEYMRTFSTNTSEYQHRPLQRQHSETLYDRTHDMEPTQHRSYGSVHNTPPHSPPRAVSPSPFGPHSTTTYTTYRTLEKQREPQDNILRAELANHQRQGLPLQQTSAQVNHNYVNEVFVHRADLSKDRTDSSNQLNELGKNLEAASESIKSSQQQQQQVPRQQLFDQTLVTHESRHYHTYHETAPEPPRVKEIEEDRIILRPIGPGVQTLEPENLHTGTLGRPSTPGFPTGTASGYQVLSPAGTLHSSPQQQQQQMIQHQQYQTQQYQTQTTHFDGHGPGTLLIDTSPKMLVAPQSSSAGSPQSPGNYNTLRHQMTDSATSLGSHSMTGQSSPSVYYGLSRRGSLSSLTDSDLVHATPKFVKDTSKYWYKPNISREEAIQILKDKPPGAFIIRDSNSFPGAYGLALKVPTVPPNVQAKPSGDPQADLVRHFLIEPTPKGVRLRGCSNEPVFGSLAALVYQHSITPLALPWKLALPEPDAVNGANVSESFGATDASSASTLLAQGAACNVVYINSVDLESLTGPQAIAKAVKTTFENPAQGKTTVVHFKVFGDGITLTDNNRKLFFRRHYPVSAVTYCGMDPQDRRWKRELEVPGDKSDARIFGFVARKQGSANENTCHIFAELDPEQPASAIVNFVTKVMIGQSKQSS